MVRRTYQLGILLDGHADTIIQFVLDGANDDATATTTSSSYYSSCAATHAALLQLKFDIIPSIDLHHKYTLPAPSYTHNNNNCEGGKLSGHFYLRFFFFFLLSLFLAQPTPLAPHQMPFLHSYHPLLIIFNIIITIKYCTSTSQSLSLTPGISSLEHVASSCSRGHQLTA